MNIIVCIKQVPNVREVKWDPETGFLIRKGIPSIITPNDRQAIEAALQLRDEHGGEVTILSMGPSQVEEALREALGMGADKAVQLTSKQFAGSDTWATSYTLGLAIQKMAGWDLIICGKEAMDGMTAQVGPQLAEFLKIPQLTYAVSLEIADGKARIRQKLGKLQRTLEAPLPALVTVEREINEPRIAPMDTIMEAYEKEIPVWTPEDLAGEADRFGLEGSPTRLKKIFSPKVLKGEVQMLTGAPPEVAAALVRLFKEKYIL
ncbi:MAG: electron transfer flavoprotein subunit beta/FixA family protein [Pseudomonadota bacterium]